MITPTPREMSPQDIVRIYVPPAPPDEQQQIYHRAQPTTADSGRFVTKESQPNSIPLLSDSSSVQSILSNNNNTNNNNNNININAIISDSQETPKQLLSLEFQSTESNNENSIIYGSGELTPVHYSLYRSDEELVKSLSYISNVGFGVTSIAGGQRSTSSSRRGSLSRKSPLAMFESNTLMECSHILAKRRLSTQSNGMHSDNRIKLSIGNSSSDNISNLGQPTSLSLLRRNSLSNGDRTKIMTSFEQLATSRHQTDSDAVCGETPIRMISNKRHDTLSPDDDESYSYSYYNSYKSAESRQRKNPVVISTNTKKYVSESNIQCKSFSTTKNNVDDDIEYTTSNKRRPLSSGIETSPFQYADRVPLPPSQTTTSIKAYKRFYGTSIDDDDHDHEKYGDNILRSSNDANEEDEPIKSSDDSSSSPILKSAQITPVNETIPLLQSSPITQSKYNIRASAQSQFKINSPSHIPVAMTPQSVKMKSPTSAPDLTSSPIIRPSRIPLVYNNQKILSATATSPVMHSSSSSSPINSPNDLNRILPPVEMVTGSAGGHTHSQLTSSPSHIDHSKVMTTSTTPNGSSFEFNVKRTSKRIGTTTTPKPSNAIRIHVNTNDQN